MTMLPERVHQLHPFDFLACYLIIVNLIFLLSQTRQLPDPLPDPLPEPLHHPVEDNRKKEKLRAIHYQLTTYADDQTKAMNLSSQAPALQLIAVVCQQTL